MIRLNVFLKLNMLSDKKAVKDLGNELVEASRTDKGCVAYDLFESTTISDHLMICETWRTEEELEAHMNTEHFKRLVPQLQALAKMTLERFNY